MSPPTTDPIERYRADGYLVVESLLSPDEVETLRTRTEKIASGSVPGYPREDIELEPGGDGALRLATVRKLNRCAENDPVFRAHACHERILDVVQRLIGPDIKLYGSQLFMKPPGGVEKPYHQDSPYFPIEPMDLVTCWTALDDVTVENGCMWVIPGSHREGVCDHGQAWMVGDRADMQIPDDAIDRSRETPIEMPAGSCSFHHSLLLHRSGANRSPHSRRGLATHYMTARSRWTDPDKPRPDFPLLRGQTYPDCV